jgi:predicted cupin superfamily sugar epimerase
VLTSFAEMWQLPEAEQQQWHRVRLNYVVYYYDGVWQVMWGRDGETESYLSLGKKTFSIKAGQRILVEGLIRPAQLVVDNPTVTVLEETLISIGCSTRSTGPITSGAGTHRKRNRAD